MTGVTFFSLEIGLIKIGESEAALQFKVINSPNEWTRAMRVSQLKEFSEVELDLLRFWQEFREFAKR